MATTLLEVPLKGVTPRILEDLQAKYPDATLRIETGSGAPDTGTMDEMLFWSIIDLFDWGQENSAAILKPAVEALSAFSKAEICKFHDLLNEKLYALDGKRFAEHLGSNAWPPAAGHLFSVDDFLYSRCGVVANGRHFFEEVLMHPERIPKEFTFEALLYLPDHAWKQKTGEEHLDYFPPLSYETFSNEAGWPGIKPLDYGKG
jgi:hypothetical protein